MSDGGVAEDEQQATWQSRLYENVERSTARTCGCHRELPFRASLADVFGGHDRDQLRGSFGKRAQGLAPHDRLRAASSDPTPQPSVRRDDRLVSRPGRGWRFDAHHGGQHARRAIGSVLTQQLQCVVGYSGTPLALRAAHTLAEGTGMSMLVMP